MTFDELLISTGVDNLIKLIHDRGRIELNAAAKQLNLPPAQVEDWAHVLEEEGIIKIEYALTKIYLMWITVPEEELAAKVEKAAERKTGLEAELGRMLRETELKGAELETIEKDYTEIYKSIDPRIAKISERIEKLKKFEQEKDAIYNRQVGKISEIKKQLESLASAIRAVESAAKTLAEKREALPAEKARSKEEIEKLKSYEQKIKERSDAIEKKYAGIMKKIEEQKIALRELTKTSELMREIKGRVSELHELKKRISKDMEELKGRQKSIESDISALNELLASIESGKAKAAEIEGALSELTSLGKIAEAERAKALRGAEEALSAISAQLSKYTALEGAAAKASSSLANYFSTVEKIKSDYSKTASEVEKTSREVSAGISNYKKELEAQLGEVKKIGEKLSAALAKKAEVERILALIRELKKDEMRLSSQLKLLSKEAKIIQLQGEPAGWGAEERAKAEALKEKIKVVKAEESEFEKKRRELRNLIEDLWKEA